MDNEMRTISEYGCWLCEDCGASLRAEDLVEHSWTEWTPGGSMPCAEWTCPTCGSEAVVEAHECNNADCDRHAPEGSILCEACYSALVKKFCAFLSELTPAEAAQVDEWTEGEYVSAIKDNLKRSGEWLDSRL